MDRRQAPNLSISYHKNVQDKWDVYCEAMQMKLKSERSGFGRLCESAFQACLKESIFEASESITLLDSITLH